jgi:hypothetical protein
MVEAAILEEAKAIVLSSDEEAFLQRWIASHIGVSAAKANLILKEFSRFLHLQEISREPLGVPPVLDMLMGKLAHDRGDTAKAPAHVPLFSRWNRAAYESTLALYRREFGTLGHCRVWPTPRLLGACIITFRFVWAVAIGMFVLIFIGATLDQVALVLLAFLLLPIILFAVFGMALFGPWGFTTTDD